MTGVYRPADGVRWRTLDDEHVVYAAATDQVHQLDLIGSLVWDLVTAGIGIEQVIASLSDRFPDAVDRIGPDVRRLVAELAASELIVAVDGE